MEISNLSKNANFPVQRESSIPNMKLGPDNQEMPGEKILPKEEAQKSVKALNHILKTNQSHLKFEYHEKLNEYYVQIVDDNTDEVIKEIPPKKLLDMVALMFEQLGILIDKKV